jgi:hypothetical protein
VNTAHRARNATRGDARVGERIATARHPPQSPAVMLQRMGTTPMAHVATGTVPEAPKILTPDKLLSKCSGKCGDACYFTLHLTIRLSNHLVRCKPTR